jgi:hypothetical protein
MIAKPRSTARVSVSSRLSTVVVLLAIAALAVPLDSVLARGTSITGYDLYRQCTATGDNEDAHLDQIGCAAYLAGYLNGIFQVSRLNRLSPTPIQACPGDIAVGQYELVFKRWAEQHPEWLSRSAPDTLAAALIEAFPCPTR